MEKEATLNQQQGHPGKRDGPVFMGRPPGLPFGRLHRIRKIAGRSGIMVNRPGGGDMWESPMDWLPWDDSPDWDDRRRGRPGNPGGPGRPGRPGRPPQPPVPQAVDPGAIRRCLNRVTDVRLENGQRFWFFPTFVGRRSVAGFRWRSRQRRWEYFGIDLDEIRSFSCRR